MNPPQLTFTREMKFSSDVVIRFTPRHSTEEVIHYRGHVFLLSDLFLICERMSFEEQTEDEGQGADMWLCYPPLAGKVLRLIDLEGRGESNLNSYRLVFAYCWWFRQCPSGGYHAKRIPDIWVTICRRLQCVEQKLERLHWVFIFLWVQIKTWSIETWFRP